eukprot:gene24736-32216_t
MNQTSKYDNLKYWLEEDLSNIVSSQDHWSQGDDNIFSRSSQYYADNADRLPEPELPETLKYTREYLLVPAKPLSSEDTKLLSPLPVDPLSKLKNGLGYSIYNNDDNLSEKEAPKGSAKPEGRRRKKARLFESKMPDEQPDSRASDLDIIRESVFIPNGLVEKGDQVLPFQSDSMPLVENQECDALWSAFRTDGYIIIRGLIDKREIDSAFLHVQNFLIQRNLIDPGTKEILKVPAPRGGDRKKVATKRGFIVSLDGQTFIVDNERNSNGHTVDAKVGAGNDCAVHLLTDSFGYLRARGYQICTPRHADIFDFKRKFKDFLAEFEKDENESRKKKLCVTCDRPVAHRVSATNQASNYKVCKECDRCYHTDCTLAAPRGTSMPHSKAAAPSPAFKPPATKVAARKSFPKQPEIVDLTLDDDDEEEEDIAAIVQETVPPVAKSEFWRCDNCRVFQHDLTLGTCWIPLQDIGSECGLFTILPGSSSLPDFYHTGKQIDEIPKSFFDPKKAKIKVFKSDVSESNRKLKAGDDSSGGTGFRWHSGPVRKGDV